MSLPAMHLQASCNVTAPRATARMCMFSSGHCLNQRSKAVNAQPLSSCSRTASALLPSRQSHCSRSRSSVQTLARQGGDSKLDAGDGFQERVVQVRRVTKVVKGGKQMSFRVVVIVGNERGQVGVGCASAKEVVLAVSKAVLAAKKELVTVPLTRNFTFPHRIDGYFGAAKVMLRPASEGTGVIAGGAVRVVLELAGIKNAFGKQLGSPNPLNNARAALVGLSEMRTLQQVAQQRDMTVEEIMDRARGGAKSGSSASASPDGDVNETLALQS